MSPEPAHGCQGYKNPQESFGSVGVGTQTLLEALEQVFIQAKQSVYTVCEIGI